MKEKRKVTWFLLVNYEGNLFIRYLDAAPIPEAGLDQNCREAANLCPVAW